MDEHVSDLYTNKAQFQDMLDWAADNAKNTWEEDFVTDLQKEFNEFGLDMFLSDKQNQTLKGIVGVA